MEVIAGMAGMTGAVIGEAVVMVVTVVVAETEDVAGMDDRDFLRREDRFYEAFPKYSVLFYHFMTFDT